MSTASAWWARTAIVGGRTRHDVRIAAVGGTITDVAVGLPPQPGDDELALVVPGFANAHSHAFHRGLRGRTHGGGGTFWSWRTLMYDLAGRLDPQRYEQLATAVFAEMVTSGWTAVGEFHYVHHQPDGRPYGRAHAMERAVIAAARRTGIRLTLLDTCYLAGGIDQPLGPEQVRFGDGSAEAWLRRWHALADVVAELGDGRVTLGAAIHSVRAVSPPDIATVLGGLPPDVPLHVHLSEQPRENADCLARYGCTPTALLEAAGALGPRLSAVHATHLTDDDVAALGSAGATVVMCPSTEADLGDGIGPARRLADAGAGIALGSDQNAVVDPLLEIRGLEAGERLDTGERGRFTPAELLAAATSAGYRSLGVAGGDLAVGAPCDFVELDPASVRTVGSQPEQVVLAATAADVRQVVVAGRPVARAGLLVGADAADADPAVLLQRALRPLTEVPA